MSEKKINKLIGNAKKSMEVEGFNIPKELEEAGRKILMGEIKLSDFINTCKEKARGYAAS